MRPIKLPFLLISCLLFISASSFGGSALSTPAIIYTTAPRYDSEAWLRGAERFPAGAKLWIHDAKRQRELFREFAASADPNVSFDGTRVLFAAKRRMSDHWQIWEGATDGTDPKQITACKSDCITPFYLPGSQFVFAERKNGRFVIETAPLNEDQAEYGTRPALSAQINAVPLTFIPGNALPTDVLRDGRILFQAAYPLGAGSKAELYTVYSDGSGVESYRCDHGADRHSGRQNDAGDIVFVSSNRLERFTSPLAHADAISSPAGQFAGDVVQLPSGDWLVSWRSSSAEPYRLMQWRPTAQTLQPFTSESGSNLVQPAVIVKRPVPNRHPSGLHEWANANILCLNAYTSKDHFDPGSIASVKVYAAATSGEPKLLGSSPVESDGSFFLHVPSDQPIRFELLDRRGKTLKKESGWFWMRRGEQRICVGCHAGPERAPDNEVPEVLQKSTDPLDLTLQPAHSTRTGGH
ncbi:MAG TPA: hypothetical protein VKW78_16485 [Terriglobales bacterium]|nr:hypothetical protein [Terriglobales bacterium]